MVVYSHMWQEIYNYHIFTHSLRMSQGSTCVECSKQITVQSCVYKHTLICISKLLVLNFNTSQLIESLMTFSQLKHIES